MYTRILSLVMVFAMMLSLSPPVIAYDGAEPPAQTQTETEGTVLPEGESGKTETTPVLPEGNPEEETPASPDPVSEPEPEGKEEETLPPSPPMTEQADATLSAAPASAGDAAAAPAEAPASGGDEAVPLPRLTARYDRHRIHYIDSPKHPLSQDASLSMGEIDEEEIPYYLKRAAGALGLESCGMYLYFIADPLIEDAATAEILHFTGDPDDPDDRMTVEITLFDDENITEAEKEARLQELRNIHIEDLQVILMGPYWEDDAVIPHSYDEDTGVIRFQVDKIGGFMLFIPDWESAVLLQEEVPENPEETPQELQNTEDTGTEATSDENKDEGTDQIPNEIDNANPPETVTQDENTVPSENPVESTEDTPAAPAGEQTVTAFGADYSVSLTYTDEANIPEGSVFELSEVSDSGILFEHLTDSVANTLNTSSDEIVSVTFVDVDVKKDGESVTPDSAVSLSIAVDDSAAGDTMTQVVALGTENEILSKSDDSTVAPEGSAAFATETESLTSTYAIVRITKQAKLHTSDDQTYLITVSYDRDDPGVPETAELVVKELKPGDEGYDEYIAASAAATGANQGNINFARAFDISLVDPDTKQECQPTKDVSVSIQLLDETVNTDSKIDVVHFVGEAGGESELMESSINGEAVEFSSPGFSVFVLISSSGDPQQGQQNEYTYSITEGSDTLLSRVLEELNVTECTLTDVTGVSFSRPSALSIVRRSTDWLLRSVAPFSGQETLTLTLKNGQNVQIRAEFQSEQSSGTVRPKITITASSATQVYNGTALSVGDEDYVYSVEKTDLTPDGVLKAGYELRDVSIAGSQTDCGVGTSLPVSARVVDTNNNNADVTDQYELIFVSGTLTVTRASVTVRADDLSKVTGAEEPTYTASVTGLVEGDTVSYQLSRPDKDSPDGERSGEHRIVAAGDAVQGNYDVSFEEGTLTIRKLTVKFYDEDGTYLGEDSDRHLELDEEIGSLPTVTDKENCTFDGWYVGDEKISESSTFDGDARADARYTVTVNFIVKNADYTSVISETPVVVDKGMAVGSKLLDDPSLTGGYQFKGWFLMGKDGKPGETQVTAESPAFSAHTDVVAKFVQQVTVIFDTDGTRHEYTVDVGDPVQLLDNPIKENARFDGWFDANGKRVTNAEGVVDENGNLIKDDEGNPVRELTATENMVLNARFVDLINIRFVVVHPSTKSSAGYPSINNEGSFTLDKSDEGHGVDEDFYNHVPAVSGYYFAGWYHVTEYSDDASSYDYDTDFVEHGRFVIDGKVYVIDDTKPVYTRNDDGTGTLDPDNSKFKEDTYVVAKLIKELTITFRYDKAGQAQQEMAVRDRALAGRLLSYYYGPLEAAPDETATPATPAGDAYAEGYRIEWYRGSTKVEPDYEIQETDDNAVFDARYIQQVTATFQNEAGEEISDTDGNVIQPVTKDINTAIGTLPVVAATVGSGDTQRHFMGWFDANDRQYTPDTILTGDVILTAKYGYQVTFKADGNADWVFVRYVAPDTALGWMPGAPYKEGHSFRNWTLNNAVVDGTHVVSQNETMIGYYDGVTIYTVTVNYTVFKNGALESEPTDTKILTVDKSTVTEEQPFVIESPVTFRKNNQNYYPVMTALQLVPDDTTGLGVKSIHDDVTVVPVPTDPTNITITVPYKQSDAKYTIYHKLLKLNGDEATDTDYVVISEETESNVPGIIGAVVSATVKDLSYAKYKKADTGTITQASGQTFSVYYTRKEFKLTYDSTVSDVRISPDTALYGASVTLPTPTRTGYEFNGWYTEYNAGTEAYSGTHYAGGASYTMMGETTLYAKWKVKSVNYTVVYKFEKFNDDGTASSFVYDSSETLQGDVGSTVYATDPGIPMKSRKAYEPDVTQNAESSVTIKADGSSVLFVYYKLVEFTFNFQPGTYSNYNVTASLRGEEKTGNNNYSYTMTVKLGQDISADWPTASNITNAYYYSSSYPVTFYGWYPDNGEDSVYVTKRLIVTEDMLPKLTATTTNIVISVTQRDNGGYVRDDNRIGGNNRTYYEFERHLYRTRRNNGDGSLTRYDVTFQQVSTYSYATKTVLYTAQWLTNATEYRVNYWLQNADDDDYTISEKYSQTYYSNSSNLGAKDIAGYTNVSTPSGYSGNGNTNVTEEVWVEETTDTQYFATNQSTYVYNGITYHYVNGPYYYNGTYYYKYEATIPGHYETQTRQVYTFNFYYNRDTFKIDYYYGGTLLDTIESVKFDANINKAPYVWTPTAAQCGLANDFTFDGWYADSGLSTKYTFGVMPSSPLVLYAKWKAPVYTVTFYVDQTAYNAGTVFDVKNDVEYGAVVGTVQNPSERENELFDYWYSQTDNMRFYPAESPILKDTVVVGHWQAKEITRYRVQYLYTDNAGTQALLPEKIVYGRWHLGDEVKEIAPYITGYAENEDETMMADSGEKTLNLTYNDDTNLIVFQYNKKPDTIKYNVYYLLWEAHDKEDKLTNAAWRVAEPKKDDTAEVVSGDYTSVTETAVAPTVEGYENYRPTKTTDTLVLGTEEDKNNLIFYYVNGAHFKVQYLDMENDSIQRGVEDFLDVGETFVLDTNVNGYTFDHLVKNGETTTETSFIVGDITEIYEIQAYYKKNLTIIAHNANKPYDGTPLTLDSVPENVTADGLKEGHTLTGIAITNTGKDKDGSTNPLGQIDVGFGLATPSNAVISGLKSGVTTEQFYNIDDKTYLPGTLSVTRINVTISVEPDRWTGNVYDGTYYPTGFTNSTKTIADYIVINNEAYRNAYLEQIWANLKNQLLDNGRGYVAVDDALMKTYHIVTDENGKEKKVADETREGLRILNQRDAGDYYEESSYFLSAATAAIEALPDEAKTNYNLILYARECRLEIAPAPLKIVTASKEKPYDGTPLTTADQPNAGMTVTVGRKEDDVIVPTVITGTNNVYKLAIGDTEKDENTDQVTITVTGSQTKPGESKNIYEIDWGKGTSAVRQENYALSETLGDLTVTDRPIIIEAQNTGKGFGMGKDPDLSVKAYPAKYVQALDEEGKPRTDEKGKPIYEVLLDEEGNQVLDAEGKPVPVIERDGDEISVSLTRWDGDNYTLQLKDAARGFTDNIPLTITREKAGTDEGEALGNYAITPAPDPKAVYGYKIKWVPGVFSIGIARVSNDGGKNWTYHEYLENAAYDSENDIPNIQGAFDRAKTLSGSVMVETLCTNDKVLIDGSDRYALTRPIDFTVEAPAFTDLTFRTRKGVERSVITRGYDGASLFKTANTVTFADIILDGGSKLDTPLTCSGNGGLVEVASGTLNIQSGATLRNSSTSEKGGAVYLSGGTAELSGSAEIHDCTAASGGGIAASGGSSIELKDKAVIKNCVANPRESFEGGGGITVEEGASLFISGNSRITENKSVKNESVPESGRGGGVFNMGRLEMSGGTISNNTAEFKGGGVYNGKTAVESAMVLNGGTISGNTAVDEAGGVHIGYASSFVMNGGTISKNSAEYGGAIVMRVESTSGNAVINGGSVTGNTASEGGALYIADGNHFTIAGGSITENTAADGSAVMLKSGASLSMSGGAITGNTATSENVEGGGAIYAADTAVRITFSGAPEVYGNFNSFIGKHQNVLLQHDSNDIIHANGLTGGAGSMIGIYASDKERNRHGIKLKPFGTYVSGNTDNLSVFINDREAVLTGKKADDSDLMVWSKGTKTAFAVSKVWLDGDRRMTEEEVKNRKVYFEVIGVRGGAGGDNHGTDLPSELVVPPNVWPTTTTDLSTIDLNHQSGKTHFSPSGGFFYYEDTDPSKTGFYIIFRDVDINNSNLVNENDKKPYNALFEASNTGVKFNGKVINYDEFMALANTSQQNGNQGAPFGEYFSGQWDGGINQYEFRPRIGSPDSAEPGIINRGSLVIYEGCYYIIWNPDGSHFRNWKDQDQNNNPNWYRLGDVGSFGVTIVYSTQNAAEQEEQTLQNSGHQLETLTSTSGDYHGAPTQWVEFAVGDGENAPIMRRQLFTIDASDPNWTKVITNLDSDYSYYVVERKVVEIQRGKTTILKLSSFNPTYTYSQVEDSVIITNGGKSAGAEVAFMKLDGLGNPLNGAEFTLYRDAGLTEPAAIEKPVVLSGNARANVFNGTAWSEASYNGIVRFEKVPAGIYYMKETAPTGYVSDSLYVVVVGSENMSSAALAAVPVFAGLDAAKLDSALKQQDEAQIQAGKTVRKGYAIFPLGENGKAQLDMDIVSYGLINESNIARKVILRKTDLSYHSLEGARFEILNYDLSRRETTAESEGSGAFWIGKLPLGKYYLHEIKAPTGFENNTGKYYALDVTAGGVTVSNTPVAVPTPAKHVVETAGSVAAGGNTGGDTPGGDTPGGDTPGGDTPGGDTPGGDTPGGDTPGGDTIASNEQSVINIAVNNNMVTSASSLIQNAIDSGVSDKNIQIIAPCIVQNSDGTYHLVIHNYYIWITKGMDPNQNVVGDNVKKLGEGNFNVFTESSQIADGKFVNETSISQGSTLLIMDNKDIYYWVNASMIVNTQDDWSASQLPGVNNGWVKVKPASYIT